MSTCVRMHVVFVWCVGYPVMVLHCSTMVLRCSAIPTG